jgi:hypothetical protein
MRKPAGIFDEEEDLDLSGFERKTEAPAAKPAAEIRAAAEAQNFQSREAKKTPQKADRRYRTGRNIPLSTKISPNANNLLYGIHDEHRDVSGNPKWTIGEILEFGLELFRKELDSKNADDTQVQ